MNTIKPIKAVANNPDLANRMRLFRSTHIEKSQSAAAKKLGLPQSVVSKLESGMGVPTYKTIKAYIEKYHLNEEWLRTGLGDMQDIPKPAESGLLGTSVSELKKANEELQAKVLVMEKTIKIMEVNQTQFINRIEQYLQRLEQSRS